MENHDSATAETIEHRRVFLQEVTLEFEGTRAAQHWKGGYYGPDKEAADFICLFLATHQEAWAVVSAQAREADAGSWEVDIGVKELASLLVDDEALGKIHRACVAELNETPLKDGEDLCCACEGVYPAALVGRRQDRPGKFCPACRI